MISDFFVLFFLIGFTVTLVVMAEPAELNKIPEPEFNLQRVCIDNVLYYQTGRRHLAVAFNPNSTVKTCDLVNGLTNESRG